MGRLVGRVVVAVAFMAIGSIFTLVYGYFSFEHIEWISQSRKDGQYQVAREAMAKDNPEYVRVFNGKIRSMTLETKKVHCYYFYYASSVIWEGGDLIYCFDRPTGRFIGQI